ncbi:MAG: hypothetical protein ABEH65_07195 [Halobacteriales archaeon]
MVTSNALDRIRQPQYTGENRCIPCTAVNVLLAIVGAIVIWTVTRPYGAVAAAFVTGVAVVVFAGMIYLRGYLVPKTPWLTKTYFPEWLLRRFDKDPSVRQETTVNDVDVEEFLKRTGAVTECVNEDDICLTDEFRARWRDNLVDLREDDTTRVDLATIFDIDPDELTFEEFDDAFVARHDGRRVGQWESHAAFLADVAATTTLRERNDEWIALDVQSQGSILNGLRIFLEQCPACDAPVTVGEEVVESCCRSIDVVAVSCEACGARLFEAEQP